MKQSEWVTTTYDDQTWTRELEVPAGATLLITSPRPIVISQSHAPMMIDHVDPHHLTITLPLDATATVV